MSVPTFLNANSVSDDSSFDATANAGTNRVLLVLTAEFVGDDVTAVSWGGDALSEICEYEYGNVEFKWWVRAIGSSGTNESKTMVVTSSDASNLRVSYLVYENVNQSSPTQGDDIDSSEGINVDTFTGNNIVYTGSQALVVAFCYAGNGTPSVSNSGYTSRTTPQFFSIGDYTDSDGSPAAVSVASTSSNGGLTAGGVVLAYQVDVNVAGSTGTITLVGNDGSVTGAANVSGSTGTINLVGNVGTVTTPKPDWTNLDKSSAPDWVNLNKS